MLYRNFNVSLFFAPKEQIQNTVKTVIVRQAHYKMDDSFRDFEKVSQGWPNLLYSMEVQEVKDGITFSVKVQPRSSKNQIVGIQSGNLKVRLVSPPVEGAANQLCVKLFSQWLGISKSKIQIIKGLKSRNKKIKIIGLSKSDFCSFMKKL